MAMIQKIFYILIGCILWQPISAMQPIQNLTDTSFEKKVFNGGNWSSKDFWFTKFNHSWLTDVSFESASLCGSRFSDCIVQETSFVEAMLSQVEF